MSKMQLFHFTKFKTFLYCEKQGFWFSPFVYIQKGDAKVLDANSSQIHKTIEKMPSISVLKIEMSNTGNTEWKVETY